MLFFTCIKLVACVLVCGSVLMCAHATACIKQRRLKVASSHGLSGHQPRSWCFFPNIEKSLGSRLTGHASLLSFKTQQEQFSYGRKQGKQQLGYRRRTFKPNDSLSALLIKKTLWPFFMDGIQLPQGQCHFKEEVYFLPLSSQIFLVLILSTSEG